MKNKLFRGLKKVLAAAASVAMLAGMTALPAAAAPKSTDKATATISLVAPGTTAVAYKYVKADYVGTDSISGYSPVNDTIKGIISDVSADPTAAQVQQLLDEVKKTPNTNTYDKVEFGPAGDDGVLTANLEAGTYVVELMSGNPKVTYNPMVISASYQLENGEDTLKGGSINPDQSGLKLTADKVQPKKSDTTLEKEIVNPGSGNKKGDDLSVGDIAQFKVTSKIPSYGTNYKNLQFSIKDTLTHLNLVMGNDGFPVDDALTNPAGKVDDRDKVAPLKITFEDGTELTYGTTGFESNFTTGYSVSKNEFNLPLTEEVIKKHLGQSVVVTYTAQLDNTAVLAGSSNPNKVEVTYTRNPDGTTGSETDITRHYTFGIDADLNGKYGEKDKNKTYELIKTGKGKTEKYQMTEMESPITWVNGGPLQGAEFKLTGDNGKEWTATSDVNGCISFRGLDAGTYKLKETKAPAGYKINENEVDVVISAEYNADGTLKSYSINVGGTNTSTYHFSYDGDVKTGKETVTVDSRVENPYQIQNDTIGTLPSTGGKGTFALTVAGVVLLVAASVFFVARRKSARD